LATLLFFAATLLIASVVFACQARGSGKWILRIATPIIAIAPIIVALVLRLLYQH
jgi:hypothetical protein